VILIGEMRDRETIETALAAAETGHLVVSTLHTLDATETINRILVAFEPHQQLQIRLQLGAVLKSVVSQRLARRKDGSGFIPAVEIMLNNARIREMIEEPGRTKEMHRAIEEGRTTWGMQTFDQSLMDLIGEDLITYEEALALSTNPEDFAVRFGGISQMEGDKKWNQNARLSKKNSEEWHGLEEIEVEVAKTQSGIAPDSGKSTTGSVPVIKRRA
jgi:twitching motility protein PilT